MLSEVSVDSHRGEIPQNIQYYYDSNYTFHAMIATDILYTTFLAIDCSFGFIHGQASLSLRRGFLQ